MSVGCQKSGSFQFSSCRGYGSFVERRNAEKNLLKTALLQFTAKYVKCSYFEFAKTAKGNIYLKNKLGPM